MIVVDTNVIAYFFIQGEKTEAARALWQRDSQWCAPRLWGHEFLNVLSTYARAGGIAPDEVRALWLTAQGFMRDREYEVDLLDALEISITADISAYDTQFVCLARQLRARLVTEDQRLLTRFPQITAALGTS